MSLPLVTIWSAQESPRLSFVLNWLLKERLGLEYRVTTDADEAAKSRYCINYGTTSEEGLSILAGTILWENDIRVQHIKTQEWQGLFTLFFNAESASDIQFDLFGAIFYLLSRYEEYLDFKADQHGRYPATASILFQSGVLERPIVDEWVEAFRLFLNEAWSITIPIGKFRFQPSYDIDIAWSYQYKGWKRNSVALLKDLLAGRIHKVGERIQVLRNKKQDPYHSFSWLASFHLINDIKPLWFFLVAGKRSRFDKNISPEHPRMAALIKAFSTGAETGLHPSYYSDKVPALLLSEKKILEHILVEHITKSRQHFIKLLFPNTYHALLTAGITDDYSMGYSTHLGFRAGTGSSFNWYDLHAERSTQLRIHPFVFMDTTALFDMKLNPDEAFQKLMTMASQLIYLNGQLITIMHNFSLGSDEQWVGWREKYEESVRNILLAAYSVPETR